MKLPIIGSRTLNKNVLDVITQVVSKAKNHINEIVTGGAVGVDAIAETFARNNNIKSTIFLPQYKIYGKKATFILKKGLNE